MEFENDTYQAQTTSQFQNQLFYTPSHNQQAYSVPPNTINHVQYQNPQNQFWIQGTNLINQQQVMVQKTLFEQPSIQIQTQQFFQQPQEDDDHDQDYQPEEEQDSDSTSSDEQQENLQEEEQFDDPDFDLQAYLKVRDQL